MKHHYYLLLLVGILFFGCKKKQEEPFYRHYGDDGPNPVHIDPRLGFEKVIETSGPARDVVQTKDGGYLITSDFLLKTDANGEVIFRKKMDLKCISPTSDGNYITASNDFKIYKIDAEANILFKAYAPQSLNSIYETSDGGFIGTFTSNVLKMDNTGAVIWQTALGTVQTNDSFDSRGVCQTKDGGYAVVGTQKVGATGDTQFVIYKVDANGTISWYNTYGDANYPDSGSNIKATADGGCVAIGTTSENAGDIRLIKLNSAGKDEWSSNYGTSISETGLDVELSKTPGLGYVIMGNNENASSQDLQTTIGSVNSTGNLEGNLQYYSYRSSTRQAGYRIHPTNDNGFIICGSATVSISKTLNLYLLKLKY